MEPQNRRFGLIAAIMLALFGIAPLTNALENPRLAAVHGSDMLQLMACGFCFGAAFMLLLVWIRLRSE
jgi:hypothetical protein